MGGDHSAVFGLIEHDAELVQPLDRVRRFHDEAAEQLRTGSEVAAAEGVEIVLNRGIVLFIGSLNAAFCHHRVRITDAQLCHDHDLRTCVVRLNSCGSTCAAAADDEHVGVVIDSSSDRSGGGANGCWSAADDQAPSVPSHPCSGRS